MGFSSVCAAMCKRRQYRFFFIWLLGLVLGTLAASKADSLFLSWMPGALQSRSSILTVLLCAALPFGIAAYAALIDRYIFLFAAALLRAFSLALCAMVIIRSFGSAGWLIQPLWQFTDLVSGSVFCWFCIRCFVDDKRLKRDLCWSISLCTAAAILDYLLVSPFLGTLI